MDRDQDEATSGSDSADESAYDEAAAGGEHDDDEAGASAQAVQEVTHDATARRLSFAGPLVSNEAPEEAGLRKLECLLQDFLSDRECLAQACRDPPDKTTRLGVAEACAGIAEAVLDAKSQDKAYQNCTWH